MIQYFAVASRPSDGAIAIMTFFGIAFLVFIFIVFPIWCTVDEEKTRARKREEYRHRRQVEYEARQTRINDWRQARADFEELRLTPEFKIWREEQYRCQEKKCAWCKKSIQCYSQYTHVDHIKPLFHGGTNNYWNLVLSCSYCNRRKGDWTTGWTGEPFEVAKHHANRKPDWIKPNKYAYGVKPDDTNTIRNDSIDYSKAMAGQMTQNKKSTPTIVEKTTSKNVSMSSLETNSISRVIRPKPHESGLQDNIPKGKAPNSYQKQPTTTRQLNDKEQQYLSDIQRMLADIRANRPKKTTSSQPIRPQYYFGPSYEGDELDPDDPEYASDQYMSYDHDDWVDKYGPER